MREYAAYLRLIADGLGLPPLPDVTRQPGANEAWRLTIRFGPNADRVAQVATLTVWHALTVLEVLYRSTGGTLRAKYTLPIERYRPFIRRMSGLGFDRLEDQPVTDLTAEVWLVERAAAYYHRDLVVSPVGAEWPHAGVIDCFAEYLPEALAEPRE